MRSFVLETHLDAPPDAVWDAVQRPRLFDYVTKGVLTARPLEPDAFPERWVPGRYKVALAWKGWLPLGWQVIGVGFPPADGLTRILRDRGHSQFVKTWDHEIAVAPEGGGTRYRDTLRLDAGVLTPLAAWLARRFFAHRQKRLRHLAAAGFDYARAERG